MPDNPTDACVSISFILLVKFMREEEGIRHSLQQSGEKKKYDRDKYRVLHTLYFIIHIEKNYDRDKYRVLHTI